MSHTWVAPQDGIPQIWCLRCLRRDGRNASIDWFHWMEKFICYNGEYFEKQ